MKSINQKVGILLFIIIIFTRQIEYSTRERELIIPQVYGENESNGGVPVIQWREAWSDFQPSELSYWSGIEFKAPSEGAVNEGYVSFFGEGVSSYLIVEGYRTENEKELGFEYSQKWKAMNHRVEGVVFFIYESEEIAHAIMQKIENTDPNIVNSALGQTTYNFYWQWFKDTEWLGLAPAVVMDSFTNSEGVHYQLYDTGPEVKGPHRLSTSEEKWFKQAKRFAMSFERYKTVVFCCFIGAAAITDEYNEPQSVPDIPSDLYGVEILRLHNKARTVIDKRVRILDVNIRWKEESPLLVNVTVLEKVRQPDYSYKWDNISRPVNISLRIHAYNWIPNSHAVGVYRDLVDCYDYYGLSASIYFDAPFDTGDDLVIYPYKVDKWKVSIELVRGLSLHDPSIDRAGVSLDFNKLSNTIRETLDSDRFGNVGATVEAVAYTFNSQNEMIELSNDFDHIWIRYFCKVENTVCSIESESQLDIFEPVTLQSVIPASKPLNGLHLQPGEIIQLGRWDTIVLRHVLLREKWVLSANEDVVEDKTFFILTPTKEYTWSETLKDFKLPGVIAGVVAGGIAWLATPEKFVSAPVISVSIGVTVGYVCSHVKDLVVDTALPEKITWTVIISEGTIIVIDVGLDEARFYVIEGAASIRDLEGNVLFLEEGKMTFIGGMSHFSPPQDVREESIPSSVTSALEVLKEISKSETVGTLEDVRARGAQVQEHLLCKNVDVDGNPYDPVNTFYPNEQVLSWVGLTNAVEGDRIYWLFWGPNSITIDSEYIIDWRGEGVCYSFFSLSDFDQKQIVGAWKVTVFVNEEEALVDYFEVTKAGSDVSTFTFIFMAVVIPVAFIYMWRRRSRVRRKKAKIVTARPDYCVRCGAKLDPLGEFCADCGNRIEYLLQKD